MRTDTIETPAIKNEKSFLSAGNWRCGFLHLQQWMWAMPVALVIGCSVPDPPQQDQSGESPIESARSHQLVQHIRDLMETKGIQRNEELGLDYYSSYGDLYDWELYFDTVLLAYYGGESYAIQGLRVFLAKQQAGGFVPRRIPQHRTNEDLAPLANPLYAEEKREHCKPFLFQIALIISRTRNSTEWITPEDYRALSAYLTHWFEEWDQDQNGLCEWSSAPHSGADTQLERIGPWGSRFCEGTDLNCFIYRDCQAASYLARALGHVEDAQMFEHRAERTAQAVRSILWNDEEGMFYDRDARNGSTIKVKSAATFLPMAVGIATPRQAQTLVERHLNNPEEFATPFPVPSYAQRGRLHPTIRANTRS